MFGRVRIESPVATPAPNAGARPSIMSNPSASAHHAVAGTSLVGETISKRNGGLEASRIAADAPTSGPARRLPMK
jgi:hypothetical protein